VLKTSQNEVWTEIEGEHPVSATTTELTAWAVGIAVALASVIHLKLLVLLIIRCADLRGRRHGTHVGKWIHYSINALLSLPLASS
jgi:hypothetical protein